MRVSKALGSMVAMAAALVALSTATDARAEDEFTATAAGKGTIEVKGKGHWHINKEAPWKATVGKTTLGKDKWTLSDGSAKVTGVPAGDAKVKVYVCNGDQCKNAEVTVKVE
jgi:ABC-type uncharacterized transport system YnjBCD substrate-binding protein